MEEKMEFDNLYLRELFIELIINCSEDFINGAIQHYEELMKDKMFVWNLRYWSSERAKGRKERELKLSRAILNKEEYIEDETFRDHVYFLREHLYDYISHLLGKIIG